MSYNPQEMDRLIKSQQKIIKLTKDYVDALVKQVEEAVNSEVRSKIIRRGLQENYVSQ